MGDYGIYDLRFGNVEMWECGDVGIKRLVIEVLFAYCLLKFDVLILDSWLFFDNVMSLADYFTQIKETVLYIQDIDNTYRFYHQLLGLEVIGRSEGHFVFFRAGTSVLLCFVADHSKTKKLPPPHYAYGKQHFAFEVEIDRYDAAKQQVIGLGIKIIEEVEWNNGQQSFYFRDPDDHVLEVVPKGVWY